MKETTRKQIEAMKAQTIGVEIEMYGITRQNVAKAAAAFFGSSRVEYTAARNRYMTWSTWDSQGREWKFQRDASIRARIDEEKCEMVTPILTYDDIERLQELVRTLCRKGAKSDPAHMCGVHIHIGAAGHDAKSLRNLANLMASHEGLLTSAIRIDQSRIWRYCRTVNRDFLTELNRKNPRPCRTSQTSGTHGMMRTAVATSTTTTAGTTCSTFTRPSQRGPSSSGFSSSQTRKETRRTAFTPGSSKATFSFAWALVHRRRRQRAPARKSLRSTTRNSRCGPG